MPRSRPPYPPEFRQQVVELKRAGRSIEGLAREFGVFRTYHHIEGPGKELLGGA